MALDLNPITFAAICEKAAHDAANSPRWLTAIGRAILELDSNPWIARDDHGGLIIGSPSGETYVSNGVCQCKAYEFQIPCWHRAASRIVRLCDEHEAAAQRASVARLVMEAEAIIAAQAAGLLTMPEGDTLDTAGMRLSRKIAAQRATAALNELFA